MNAHKYVSEMKRWSVGVNEVSDFNGNKKTLTFQDEKKEHFWMKMIFVIIYQG